MERIQKQRILKDLDKKMVLIAGPRQAGKTTLAKSIASDISHSVYLNYDSTQDREIISQEAWLPSTKLLVLDELHKMPEWKNYLKGVYDTKPEQLKIIVTGSARLDISQQFGDSLAGRYYLHRLLPFSPAELKQLGQPVDLDRLIDYGNFPEPYLENDLIEAQRWRQQYTDSLLREDVLNFDEVHNVKAIRLVFELLRERVGSPVSFTSIAEDIQVSPNTVRKYIQILEALYIIFRVTPFSKNIARSLLKEPKIYFFDTGLVRGNKGIKFENLVANCLLKHCYARGDYFAERVSLHYLRTKEKHEVDFAIIKDDSVQQMIEVKTTNHDINKSLIYFHNKYQFPAVQVVKELKRERMVGAIKVVAGINFLSELEL
jgi:hypothetical protein